MSKTTVLLLLATFISTLTSNIVSSASFVNQYPVCKTDYYWRDYDGTIPHDALVAGFDAGGVPIYISQAYVLNEVIPGTISRKNPKALVLAHGFLIETDFLVKILCSPNNYRFRWVQTNSQHLNQSFVNNKVLIGGVEAGQVLYIGRVFDRQQTHVGKVFADNLQYRGLWVPAPGGQVNFLAYEILTYSCIY